MQQIQTCNKWIQAEPYDSDTSGLEQDDALKEAI